MMMTVFTTAVFAWVILGDSLTTAEIITILFGTFGMFMFANPSFFMDKDDAGNKARSEKDTKEYPYYSLGVAIAISVTIFMAFEFIAMSNLKAKVHSSWKTFTLGWLCSVCAGIYILFKEPKFYYGWIVGDSSITWAQIIYSIINGFFAWACLESKSLALSTVKSGTVTCFTNLSLVVSFIVDVTAYERSILWTDIVGGLLLIVFTSANGLFSNMSHAEKEKAKQEKREQRKR